MTGTLPAVCILAGGRGTRLGKMTESVPKPLLPVAGKPFLIHQLAQLADAGFSRAVLCVGYLGEQIENRLGDEQCGVALDYSYDPPGREGTLEAIRHATPLLGERFLYLYGDTFLRLDHRRFTERWEESGLPAAMTVLRNSGRWGTSNVVYRDDLVLRYDKSLPAPDMHWIDYGLGGLTREALDQAGTEERDLTALQADLAHLGLLFGFEVQQRFYEIGTPTAFAETETFLRSLQAGRSRTSNP